MKLQPALYEIDIDGHTSHGDLVTQVTRLAQCLLRTPPTPGDPVCRDRVAMVESAISSALAAEKAVVQHLARIAHLEQLAGTDPLTSALNRRGFEEELRRALAAAARYDEGGMLVYVDLDDFKLINDNFGHAAGDEVLRAVARLLMDNVRGSDAVGRLGGDEFAALLTRASREDGLARADTLKSIINTARIPWQGHTIGISASFGYKAFGPDDKPAGLLSAADRDMYECKRRRSGQENPESPPPVAIYAAE